MPAWNILLLCTVVPALSLQAADPLSGRQWEMMEVPFRSSASLENPADVSWTTTFRHSDGQQFEVPGFWNGGRDYLVRFTPPLAGQWTFTSRSSHLALDLPSGVMQVEEATEDRHGGIIVHPNDQRRFSYQDGTPYAPIAFECDWLFALDAENPDGIPQTETLVGYLAQQGFNQIVMNVYAHDVTWEKDQRLVPEYEYGSPRVFPFGGNNENPDHTRLQSQYFHRLDRVLDCLDRHGIAAHLMIYVWNKRVSWPESESEEDNRYFDYVVKRYQAYPNVVWDISKEALGYGHNDVDYITRRIDRLRTLDAHHRLVTVHDYQYCRKFPDKVDFISVQLWGSELHGIMRNTLELFPGKPVLNIEHGGYEEGPYRVFLGNYTSAEVCLERSYQCVFAGSYTTHYWQGAAWNVVIADIDSLPSEDRPKLDYYRHLRSLYDKYSLDEMRAGEKHSNSGFCLHDGERLFIFYVPKENVSMNINLPKKFRGGMMTGTWFDPFTGEFGAPIPKAIEKWPVFMKPPSDRFAILIVKVDKD